MSHHHHHHGSPPNSVDKTNETEYLKDNHVDYEKLIAPQASPIKHKIVVMNVIRFSYLHIAGLYGLYLCFTSAKLATSVFAIVLFFLGNFGITAGAHRLWSHNGYKVKLPLEILLMVFNSIAFQNTIFTWVRDHRLHHKYTDTDADPHNATRGFFFSHIGWLLVRKHPMVKIAGKSLDMSDIYCNPLLRFQKKYAIPFIGTICFIIPTLAPMYFWGESLNNAWHITVLRYIFSLNGTFLVNSAAHLWGYKPYDKSLKATQSGMANAFTFGEGFHNYHHVFPWDYRADELGDRYINLTTRFIDFFAWMGWAYDLKTASTNIIEKRALRTGDGTYKRPNGMN
nr:delta11 fatty acyl-CoA desaturase [synthetic construct]